MHDRLAGCVGQGEPERTHAVELVSSDVVREHRIGRGNRLERAYGRAARRRADREVADVRADVIDDGIGLPFEEPVEDDDDVAFPVVAARERPGPLERHFELLAANADDRHAPAGAPAVRRR